MASHMKTGNGSGRLMFGQVEEMKTKTKQIPKLESSNLLFCNMSSEDCVFSLACVHMAKISVVPNVCFPLFLQ